MFREKRYDIVTIKIESCAYQVKDTKPLGHAIMHVMNEFLDKSLIDRYMIGFTDTNICECDWSAKILDFSEERLIHMMVKDSNTKYKFKLAQYTLDKKIKYAWVNSILHSYDYLI